MFLHAAAATCAAIRASAATGRPPRIVLRSSWQTVNIGDIGHTPGVLALLEKHLPEAEVTLWPSNIGSGVEAMLRRRFPKLRVTFDQADAFEHDFLLHGSGPSLVARKHVEAWRRQTGKPYGIYGITMAPGTSSPGNTGLDDDALQLLESAAFVFLRDGVSLKVVKDAGLKTPIIGFAPDGAFAADVRDDSAAEAFLRQNGLEDGRFLCFFSRLRYSPYWKIKPNVRLDEAKHARNEAMKEHDHKPLRDVITAVVRQTGLKALLVPEDSSQMESCRELLFEPLPEDVKSRVVWRKDFWLTDEAISTYVRSSGLVSLEMHSPIMALGHGVPSIVCRFAEQTSKGTMWSDIGLGEWLFDFDQPGDVARLLPTALALAKDPDAAKLKAARALEFVRLRQRETMEVVRRALA
jgi:polysaccharide pyruvyl transferase WcaK-like protein